MHPCVAISQRYQNEKKVHVIKLNCFYRSLFAALFFPLFLRCRLLPLISILLALILFLKIIAHGVRDTNANIFLFFFLCTACSLTCTYGSIFMFYAMHKP